MIKLRNLAGTALALAALLAACAGQNVPIDAEPSVVDYTVVYDGQPQTPEITFDPPGAEIGAEVVITPEDGPPLESGTWPTDAGVYAVVVRASAEQGGREAEGTLTITPRPVSVVPSADQAKAVGDADPELTFAASGLVLEHELSGALEREPGEVVGSYAFELGSLDGGPNYAVSLAADAPSFAIVTAVLGDGAISVSGTSVVYDGLAQDVMVVFDPPAAGADAVVSYEGLAAGVLPVDAGTYPFEVVAGPGYDGSVSGELVIAARPVSVLPAAGQSKAFDELDPVFVYVPSGLVGDDTLSGALERASGEVVGSYDFSLGTLAGGPNYDVSLAADAPSFAIVTAVLGDGAISVSGTSVVYDGSPLGAVIAFDPPAAGVGSVVTYAGFDAGVLPVDAGSYPFAVVAGPGYDGSVSGTFVIEARPVSVVPTAGQSKVFDEADPVFAFDASGLVGSDQLSGALERELGEDVGSYAFTLGSLEAGSNYAVALAADAPSFMIQAVVLGDGAISVSGTSVVYDGSPLGAVIAFDPPAAGVGSVVTYAGFDAGVLPVDAGSYPFAVVAGPGYDGSVSGTFVIEARPVSVLPSAGQSKAFDELDPVFAFDASGLVDGDELAGALAREPGEVVGSYAFALGSLDAGSNYAVALAVDAPSFAIVDAVLADGAISVSGTSVVYDGSPQGAVVTFDPVAAGVGAVVTYAGFEVGVLPVEAGTYPFAVVAGPGYDGSVSGELVIAARPVSVVPTADQSKAFGEADPVFAFDASGLVGSDQLSGALERELGEVVGSYAFALGSLAGGSNYDVSLAVDAPSFAITTVVLGEGAISVSGTSVVYDGAPQDVVVTFDPPAAGDGAIVSYQGFAAGTSPVNAGSYAFAVVAGPGYDGSASGTLVVDQAALGVADVLWADKGYDGGTGATASATLATASVVAGDDVALASQLVGRFASANVGTHAVTGSFELVGASAANYVVAPQPTGTAAIQPRPVALLDATLAAKTFDGTDVADVSGVLESHTVGRGVLPADVARLSFEASFAQVGATDAPVSVEVRLTGAATDNYYLAPVPTFSAPIATAVAVVLPDAAQSKIYGDDDAVLAFTVSGLLGDDAVTGALGRVPGEDVGTYAFEIDTLDAGTDYALVLADEAPTFEVLQRAITLSTTESATLYGTMPNLAAVLADGSTLRAVDVLFGSLARPDESVGTYDYALGTATIERGEGQDAVDVSANYAISFGAYEVLQRPLTITALDQVKTYGDEGELGTIDFAVASSDDVSGLVGDEHVNGVVLTSTGAAASATVAGGPYAIVASDATGTIEFDAANYDITYVPGSLTVEQREVTVSGTFTVADKAYDGTSEAGAVDLSGLVLNNLADGDDVGFQAVASFPDALVGDGKVATLTTVTLSGTDAGNYSIALEGAPTTTGSMVKADIAFGITIAGTGGATEVVYDGDRTFQPNVTTDPNPVPSNAPVAYYVEITYVPTGGSVGSFNPVGIYTVTVTADDPRYVGSSTQDVEVVARPITIASSATVKTFGTLDPAMFPSLADGTTFGRNESFFLEGALTYVPGDQATPYAVGSYPLDLDSVAIYRGLHQDVTANYAITFASGFEIVPAIVTVTPDADQGKTYGEPDAAFTFVTEGLLDGADLTGVLGRELGEDVGTYAFTLGDLDAGANYTLGLADVVPTYAIVARALTLTTAVPAYTYGNTDLDLVAVLAQGSALRGGDVLAGDLALSATEAGTHVFFIGDATLMRGDVDVATNYTVAFADYTMAERPAIVTPNAGQGKTYGDADPVFGYTTDLLDGDLLTGALARVEGQGVGTYAFALGDLANPNYVLAIAQDAPTFAITARPILLEATVASKHFSDLDPDLSPVLGGESSLRGGDALFGALAHAGVNVGTYPLLLDSVHVLRGDVDVSANYAVTLGTFVIDPLPVVFDISNADLVTDGDGRTHVFFDDGLQPIRGLTVAVTPEGANPTYRFSYLWTHGADHVPFTSPIAVQAIQDLGTYQVTITATSANHVGATALTVWVTDATGVAFVEPAYEALVGATVDAQVQLVGPDGTPRFAGPVPVAVDLSSNGLGVAFETQGEPEPTTTVQIASGATGTGVGVIATSFGDPALLTATVVGGGTNLAFGTATFAPTVQLAFEPSTVERGAGAVTEPVTLRLTGHQGIAVPAPSDLWVDLHGSPEGLAFLDAAAAQNVPFVIVPSGSSEATFRMLADAAGTYTATALHMAQYGGVASGELTFVVAPRPVVGTIAPASVDKAQTTSVTVTGTGFAQGAAVEFSGNDVAVDSVIVVSPTELSVNITIDATTDLGARDITVTNPDGGTSTTADALTLTVPTLTANDDGTFDVVEGGNHTLSIANDLLANDTWTGSTAFAFDGVVDVVGLTHAISGDALTVSAAAGTGGSTASLTYRIRDAVFGMTSTATVDFDVTLAPVDAILFTDSYEFEDFLTTEYTVPTFAEIFASWPRFSNSTYYADSTAWAGTTADAWFYTEDALGGRVVFPLNASYDGIVSPDAFEYYTHEATLYSTNSDDDSVGIIIALSTGSGSPRYLVANRSNGHLGPSTGWGLSYYNGSSLQNLVAASVPGFTTFKNSTGSGWQQSGASRVKVERSGDIVRIYATDWFTANAATATPPYPAESMITVDLATGEITYYDGFGFRTTTTANDLGAFRGAQPYGYFVWSQADTSYLNIDFAGGAAQDTAILLTAYDAQADAYGASQVWRFGGGLWTQSANDIQTELGFPRDVTSVASPNPSSAYSAGYSVFGDRFRIEATTVRPIVD